MTIYYLDPEGGSDAADGLSFANRWKTFASGPTAVRTAPGDIIRIIASPDPTSLGSCTWASGSATVTLPGAVTAEIDDCDVAWTASANVTQAQATSNFREGAAGQQFTVASGFTTGKLAYKDLGGTFDFSGYEQISFWMRTSVQLLANNISIRLCSDAIGDVPVDTFTITHILPGSTSGTEWYALTLDKGSALGSAIQSISIACALDPGTPVLIFDHFIACKAKSAADSLSLTSLIGKNNGNRDEPWFPIRSIVGTTVTLGWGVGFGTGTASQGLLTYRGTSEAVTTYKREFIDYYPISQTLGSRMNEAGSVGSPITYSGGWDRTAMSTQDSATFMRFMNASQGALGDASFAWGTWERMKVLCTGGPGVVFGSTNKKLTECAILCAKIGVNVGSTGFDLDFDYILDAASSGGAIYITGVGRLVNVNVGTLLGTSSGTAINGETASETQFEFPVVIVRDRLANFTVGVNLQGVQRLQLREAIMSNNTLDVSGNAQSLVAMNRVTWNPSGVSSRVLSQDDQKVAGASYLHYGSRGLIQTATDQRHTAADVSWKFLPQSTTDTSQYQPLELPVARVAVNAGTLCTAKIWLRKNSAGVNCRFVLKAYAIHGVTTDQSAVCSGVDAWEEVTVTFTPTQAGVVEFHVQVWDHGGTTNAAWADDFSFTQA